MKHAPATQTVPIITYGTLMTGERNHRFCRNAVSIKPCTILGTLFDTGYGFPAFEPYGAMQVKAELMEIPLADWAEIDRLEGYPNLYDRRLYSATLADGTGIDGWVYVMNELPKGAKLIESGDWKAAKEIKKSIIDQANSTVFTRQLNFCSFFNVALDKRFPNLVYNGINIFRTPNFESVRVCPERKNLKKFHFFSILPLTNA